MTISVSHDDFAAAITGVRAAASRLGGRRDRICREVDTLVDGGWHGAAADSFAEAWEDWRLAAQRVLAGLIEMGTLLDAAHRDLSERDEQSRLALEAVAGRIVERLG
jgi:WXG100 family type VII secretion target